MDKIFLSLNEAATVFGVCKNTMYKWIHKKFSNKCLEEMGLKRIGGGSVPRYRFIKSKFMEFVNKPDSVESVDVRHEISKKRRVA